MLQHCYTPIITRIALRSAPAATTAALPHSSSLPLKQELTLQCCRCCQLHAAAAAINAPATLCCRQHMALKLKAATQRGPVLYAAASLDPHHYAHSAPQHACCHHCCLA
jgi:hypothetical protein